MLNSCLEESRINIIQLQLILLIFILSVVSHFIINLMVHALLAGVHFMHVVHVEVLVVKNELLVLIVMSIRHVIKPIVIILIIELLIVIIHLVRIVSPLHLMLEICNIV